MHRAMRAFIVLLLAFLIQSSFLPHLRIYGIAVDLVVITLCSLGFSSGYYVGFTAGLFEALLMEVAGGDLAGFSAIACLLAGVFGAYVVTWLRRIDKTGRRGLAWLINRFAPMVAIGLFVLAKESIYVVYFYLTGVDITFAVHISRVLVASLLALIVSLPVVPLLYRVMNPAPKEPKPVKDAAKRRKKGEQKLMEMAVDPPALPQEGGTDE